MKNNRWVFFAITLIGFYIFSPMVYQPWKTWYNMQSWQETTCAIVSSHNYRQVTRKRSGGYTSHLRAQVDYQYVFENKTYQNSQITIDPFNLYNVVYLNTIMQIYPNESTKQCYVNPEKPAEAVLDRDINLLMGITIIPILMLIAGIGGIYREYFPKSTATKSLASTGYYDLSQQSSPMVRLIVALLFALCMGGATAMFYYIGWRPEYDIAHHIPPVLTIILVFMLLVVGIAILSVIHSFLNLFNPSIALMVDNPAFTLGQSYQLRYHIRGRSEKITALSLTLVCKEINHNSKHSKKPFESILYEDKFFQYNSARVPAQGEAEFSIPARESPTQTVDSTEIVWTIEAKGTIPNWPDMTQEFKIIVRNQNTISLHEATR